MSLFDDNVWIGWLMAAAVLGCLEMLTADFTLLMLAVGAAAGAAAAAVAPGMWVVQVVVAALVAGLLLALLRPTLLRRVRDSVGYRSSLDIVVGSTGYALGEVTDHSGTVRVNGDTWTARLVDAAGPVEDGDRVEVYAVEGTTLLVYPSDGQLDRARGR